MNEQFEPQTRFWEHEEQYERLHGNFVVACVVASIGWTLLLVIFLCSITGWK